MVQNDISTSMTAWGEEGVIVKTPLVRVITQCLLHTDDNLTLLRANKCKFMSFPT